MGTHSVDEGGKTVVQSLDLFLLVQADLLVLGVDVQGERNQEFFIEGHVLYGCGAHGYSVAPTPNAVAMIQRSRRVEDISPSARYHLCTSHIAFPVDLRDTMLLPSHCGCSANSSMIAEALGGSG